MLQLMDPPIRPYLHSQKELLPWKVIILGVVGIGVFVLVVICPIWNLPSGTCPRSSAITVFYNECYVLHEKLEPHNITMRPTNQAYVRDSIQSRQCG